MTANTSQIFPAVPKAFAGSVATANTNRDGTGDLVTIADGGDNGAIIDRVVIKARGNTVSGAVRLFVTTGEATYLLSETPVQQISIVGAGGTFVKEVLRTDGNPLVLLGPGDTLQASTHTSHHFDVIAFGGLY